VNDVAEENGDAEEEVKRDVVATVHVAVCDDGDDIVEEVVPKKVLPKIVEDSDFETGLPKIEVMGDIDAGSG
jgi:hypothetical protein